VEDALSDRVAVASRALKLPDPGSVGSRVRTFVDHIADATARDAWLAFTALAGSFPTRDELGRFRRAAELSSVEERVARVLETTVDLAGKPGRATRRLELVDSPETVLVDVSFSADNEHNTGVQRVVRSFVPEWVKSGRPVRLVRWSPFGGAYVELNEIERDRILSWGRRQVPTEREATTRLAPRPILVPWGAAVFFPEVLQQSECAQAACLAEFSGARIGLIGHDTIPISSADTVPEAESERFAKFLDVVKHSDLVSGVSNSAAGEFQGFVSGLVAQGLPGPTVVAVPNAVDTPAAAHEAIPGEADADELPIVLCVGSHEPRKNQDIVLAAAEELFEAGIRFRMVFVGAGGREQTAAFDRKVARWQKRGMAVESHRRLADAELWSLYRRARFNVLLSLHEGFGLPVAESVSLGTPVLTSNYGSLAEVAAVGGCVTVDPRDEAQIVETMRTMLVDDELIGRLRAEAAAVPSRSWETFAAELWDAFAAVTKEAAA
jgi:glycosyltransferase involved in cell wall biosynthesis